MEKLFWCWTEFLYVAVKTAILACLTCLNCLIPKLLGDCAVGDVITGINDRKVTKAADLAIALDSFQVGEKVTLKVRRGDEGSQVQC